MSVCVRIYDSNATFKCIIFIIMLASSHIRLFSQHLRFAFVQAEIVYCISKLPTIAVTELYVSYSFRGICPSNASRAKGKKTHYYCFILGFQLVVSNSAGKADVWPLIHFKALFLLS